MRPLSISELEQETGVGRHTVYYYISEGLLPPAQKASATRAVYDQSHVDLLREITRLKSDGLSLKQIREKLADRIEAAAENGVDLVAQQSEATRDAILQAAARRFAEHGYAQTRISDICRDVRVTAQVLYSHFSSKWHLFIACWDVYYRWMNVQVVSPIGQTSDSAARLAWRVWAGQGIQALSPDLQAMARVEAFHPESELRPLVREVYGKMLAGAPEELAADRKAGSDSFLFDDELVSYGFLGALESMQMRASWDDRYTREDIVRNLIGMFIAVRAVYQGRVDITEDWKAVAELSRQLANSEPRPPELRGTS
jgi:AcrR family transcriptional regulator/predicted DNA-binding transcriptional regulator AlpA